MTIYNIEPLKEIKKIPHQKEFDRWIQRLTTKEIEAIREELNRIIDSDDKNEVHTSSWIPGPDWTGTVYEPIYSTACRCNQTYAGLCFGLFVWEAFMNHHADWAFGRYKIDGQQIAGLTYFRIHR